MSRASRSKREGFATAFGAALDEELARTSVRKTELARRLSTTPQYVTNVVRGSSSVSPSTAANFADALNLTGTAKASLVNASLSDTAGYDMLKAMQNAVIYVCPHCGKRSDEPVK